MGAIKVVSRRSGRKLIAGPMGWLKSKRGELQSSQRRDRFGVHRTDLGRIDLKVPLVHQVASARRTAL
jgi:hypothetical protein